MSWKVLATSDSPNLVKTSSRKNGVEQFLGVAPPPGGSPKRQFLVAFEGQEEAVEEDEVPSMSMLEKKRRLTGEQVQFLERSFETEIKLEPERKALIAKELGLQPRQVAVWFQNRRARWKNKSLESDFHMLKAKYDAVVEENDKLKAEVSRLHSQLKQKTPVDTPTEQQQQETSAGNTTESIHNPSVHNNSSPSISSSFSSSPKSEVDDPLDPSLPALPPPSLISVALPQALESLQQQQPPPSLPPMEDLFSNTYLFQHLSMSMKLESGLFSEDGLGLSGSHLLFTWDDNPTLSPWYDY